MWKTFHGGQARHPLASRAGGTGGQTAGPGALSSPCARASLPSHR
ncbi:Hypothetical protein AA314_07476 [Archangium gephyra]|uniref:Uncharacterized protein n=1 Tax=Archangium gephyra TaxID=48 RepID=A0AAC8THG7_9BACT|nr:Hypothetical protein AA314_07476 [Archangium gephyra]